MFASMQGRSLITISETPGRGTVDLELGDITVAMRGDRSLLDVIEVRTPNAVATARGGTRMRAAARAPRTVQVSWEISTS